MNSKEYTLGQKIKNIRKERKMTQEQLSGDFITRTMLSKIENDVATPSIETIKYLCQKLDIPISNLLENFSSINLPENNDMEEIFEHSSFLIKNQEFNKCKSYLLNVLNSKKIDKNNSFYLKFIYNLSLCYIKCDDLDDSKKIINENIESFYNLKDYFHLSKMYFNLGLIYFIKENYIESEMNFNNSIQCFKKSYISDILYEVTLYYNFGYSQYKQEKYHLAITNLNYSYSLSKDNNCLFRGGEINMLLGIIYKKINELNKAIDYTEKATKYFEFIDNKNLLASCQKNIGNYYILAEQYDKAIEYLNNSLHYFEEIGNLKHYNIIKCDIFTALVKKKMYEKALEYASEINHDLLDNNDKAIFYNNLGKCYIDTSSIDKAKKFISYAKEMINPKEFYILHDIYFNLSNIYSKSNDYENAYKYSKEAQFMLKKALSDK